MARPADLFKRPRLAATRIDRAQEKRLGRFILDAATADALGRDSVGVMVSRCEHLSSLVRCLRHLESEEDSPRWLVMVDSKVNASYVCDHWQDPDTIDSLRTPAYSGPLGSEAWTSNNVVLGTVEAVSKFVRRLDRPSHLKIAGVFLVDPKAHIHCAREISRGSFSLQHDRPQIVVDLRELLADSGWAPPLFILTAKAPRAIAAEAVMRAYCLNALQYLDGRTLRIARQF
jgi:hypothetical protein